ncbi:MAG: hypothetical protein HY074_01660 [Deltaproteobacteria bacterium]|nr:hypothetical protein [Deltaproteobacteria bacterium]
MKLLMDGALKVESKIFDSTANVWKLAADVIPYLQLSSQQPPKKASGAAKAATAAPKPAWNPPPKPTELKDVHIVDLNSEATGAVDYFALINNQQKAIERGKAATRAQSSREAKESEAERQRRAQAHRQVGREALTAARRSEPAKITRVAPPHDTPVAAAIAASPADEVENKVGVDGILVAEVDPGMGIGNVVLFARRVRKFARENKSAVSVAASLAFVFASTYGVVRMMSGQKGREPANTVVEVAKAVPPPMTAGITSPSSTIDDQLGSGRNRIKRASGAVSYVRTPDSSYPRVVPPLPMNPNALNRGESPRDSAQYYNSAEQGAVTAAGPPQNDYNGNQVNTDPNAGVVNPPNTLPPTQPYNNDPSQGVVNPSDNQNQYQSQ